MYSFKEIWVSLPIEKKKADGPWTKFVLRPAAVPVTWLALAMGLKANTISYLSSIFSIAGAVLFSMKGYWLPLWGAILLNIFSIFDCVDGNVARITKTSSPWGGWADAIMGFVAYCAVFLSMGVYIYNQTGWWWMLLITGFTSSANLLARVAYQAYKNIVGKSTAENATSLEQKLAETVGVTGLMMPCLILFHIFFHAFGGKWLWALPALAGFNFAFYGGGCFITIVKLALKNPGLSPAN